MYRFDIKEISKEAALEMIQKYHYSKTLPKINKYFLGFYLEYELVGVVTLGWGTRPRHTDVRPEIKGFCKSEYVDSLDGAEMLFFYCLNGR